MFICECGKHFEKSQSYNGHCSRCLKHLEVTRSKDNFEKAKETFEKSQLKAAETRKQNMKTVMDSKFDLWVAEKHHCEQCGILMTAFYGSGRFCSRSCSNKWVALHQSDEAKARKIKALVNSRCIRRSGRCTKEWWQEHPEAKISQSVRMKEVMQGPEIRSKISRSMTGRQLSQSTRDKISQSNRRAYTEGRIKCWQPRGLRSTAEMLFEQVLIDNNIPYITEKVISKTNDLHLTSIGYYSLDFYLPTNNVDLEIDGKQHSYDDRKEHDFIRDSALCKAGYKVYRVHLDRFGNLTQSEINRFLSWYKGL